MQKQNWRQLLNLTKELAITDFKLRYYGSVLGYFWSLMKPFMLFGVIYVAFSNIMRFETENYSFFLLLGIISWNFFADATMAGSRAILDKANLITKIYFPRIVVVIAASWTAFLTFIINLFIFFVFYVIAEKGIPWTALFFPFYILLIYALALGISFALSVFTVKFRDVTHIWEVLLQVGFWGTPIIYPLEIIAQKYHRIFYLNPMTRIIEHSRALILYGTVPDLRPFFVLVAVVSVVLFVGYLIFKRLEKKMPELV